MFNQTKPKIKTLKFVFSPLKLPTGVTLTSNGQNVNLRIAIPIMDNMTQDILNKLAAAHQQITSDFLLIVKQYPSIEQLIEEKELITKEDDHEMITNEDLISVYNFISEISTDWELHSAQLN